MAKIEVRSEGVVASKFGDGPNFVELGLAHDSRVKLSAGAGVSGEAQTSSGRFLGALGSKISGALKLNRKYNPREEQANYSQDRIGLREAGSLLTTVQNMTGGSGDLTQLNIEQFDELRRRHPSLLRADDHKRFDRILASGSPDATVSSEAIGIAQSQLVNIGNAFPQLQQYSAYQIALSELQTGNPRLANLKGQKISDIGAVINTIDSNWRPGVYNLLEGQSANLTPVQKQQVVSELDRAGDEISKTNNSLANLPTAQQVRDAARRVDTILGHDPKLDLSISATGAYAHHKGIVLAGDVTKGMRATVDNVAFVRDTPNGKLRRQIDATRYSSLTLSAGVGGDNHSALPPEMASKLGVIPAAGTNMGGYIAATRERANTLGVSINEQVIAAGFNVSKKLSGDNFTYANVEGSCSKSPAATPKSDCKISVKTGFKF